MATKSIETTIDIAAPCDRVWSTLVDHGKYPEWSRFILSITGRAEEGQKLQVRLDDGSGPITMKPTVLVSSAEQKELRWLGTVVANFVFAGEHYFRLTPLDDEHTRLTHGEVFSGMLAPLLWKTLDTRTRKAFHAFNQSLRERAEALVPTRPVTPRAAVPL